MSRLRRSRRTWGGDAEEAEDKGHESPVRPIGRRQETKPSDDEKAEAEPRQLAADPSLENQAEDAQHEHKAASNGRQEHKQPTAERNEAKARAPGQREQKKSAKPSPLVADKDLEPLRTDPVKSLRLRRALLDRVTAEHLPELHIIGEIRSGEAFGQSANEGVSCSWSLHHGKHWNLLSPETNGQTQYGYAELGDAVVFNHPIDIHLATKSIAQWPRLLFRAVKIDMFGRQIFLGCGFAHLPSKAGYHEITVRLWRPVGASEEELAAYFLGHSPALLTDTPIYDTAWRDRCKLVTTNTGHLQLNVTVLTRHFEVQRMDTVAISH